MTDVDLMHAHEEPPEDGPFRLVAPLWLAVALLIAGLAIGTGIGVVWSSHNIDDATVAAETAAEASLIGQQASEQASENGRRSCLIADALRLLILAQPDLDTSDLPPAMDEALARLRALEGVCQAALQPQPPPTTTTTTPAEPA